MADSLKPTIVISMGDPAGIGPEVSLKALTDPTLRGIARWVLVGEGWLVADLGEQVGFLPTSTVVDPTELTADSAVTLLDVRQIDPAQLEIGRVSAACGSAGLYYVRTAVEMCDSGVAQAMVTAPLSKQAVALAGIPFCGHTEYIANLCGTDESRMLLVNDQLCVVHVSTHCSLNDAIRPSTARILKTIEFGNNAMVSQGWTHPRVAVCGLNPHAGEYGMFGDEEEKLILPAIRGAQNLGIDCEGPFPADTVFLQAVRGKYDLVVAMYHDQGHIPMKLLDFEHTVNVTLGLPIIRTSVDHGTAFDIAGQNQADASDMKSAMRLAVSMAQSKFSMAKA